MFFLQNFHDLSFHVLNVSFVFSYSSFNPHDVSGDGTAARAMAKLNESGRNCMRKMKKEGKTWKEIGGKFGVRPLSPKHGREAQVRSETEPLGEGEVDGAGRTELELLYCFH